MLLRLFQGIWTGLKLSQKVKAIEEVFLKANWSFKGRFIQRSKGHLLGQ
jgi:hypothetical protein